MGTSERRRRCRGEIGAGSRTGMLPVNRAVQRRPSRPGALEGSGDNCRRNGVEAGAHLAAIRWSGKAAVCCQHRYRSQ